MKELEKQTLDEIIESGNQENLKLYYTYLNSLKNNHFYKELVESFEGYSIEEITYKIMEAEQECRSEMFFSGDITMFYPHIMEQKAKKIITCDFSAGIIYPGSLYINYRPMIHNITSGDTYVLQRTLKVELGYVHYLPRSITQLESLDNKLHIEGYDDNSGIDYSHLSQCLGGEILLQKLKRRGKK